MTPNSPIQEVYEKYKHLDSSLCDKDRLLGDVDVIVHDLWMAIKAERQHIK